MANCLYCKHFIKLRQAEGCQKYRKILLTWEKDCPGYEFAPGKFLKNVIAEAGANA